MLIASLLINIQVICMIEQSKGFTFNSPSPENLAIYLLPSSKWRSGDE